MAITKRELEAMASVIQSNMADVATPTGFILDEVGVRAVTRVAIGLMNMAWESNTRFDGRRFITAAGLIPWVEWHEGMTHKNAQWTRAMRDHVAAVDAGERTDRRIVVCKNTVPTA